MQKKIEQNFEETLDDFLSRTWWGNIVLVWSSPEEKKRIGTRCEVWDLEKAQAYTKYLEGVK